MNCTSFLASEVSRPSHEGRIAKLPFTFEPQLMAAQVPDHLVGMAISELAFDDPASGWCGTRGNELTFVMIKHAPKPDLRIQIDSLTENLEMLKNLEWLSSKQARVHKSIALPGKQEIPHGYMVDLKQLKECVGRELLRQPDGQLVATGLELSEDFHPMQLCFKMPEFDVCPSAHTTFLQGDTVYFGCREKSFRFISIDDLDQLELLRQSLEVKAGGRIEVAREVTVLCTKEKAYADSQEGVITPVTLLPGFAFCGQQRTDKEIVPGIGQLQLNRTLVFEFAPLCLAERNFGDSLLQGPFKVDFDYFRVAQLGKEYRLGARDNPVSRYALRVNMMAVARLKPNGVEYFVDWWCGPESTIRYDDLVLLPRIPPRDATQPSLRFWSDEDVSERHALPHPNLDDTVCTICCSTAKDSCLVRCGHTFCGACATRFWNSGDPCPNCRQPIESVNRFFPSAPRPEGIAVNHDHLLHRSVGALACFSVAAFAWWMNRWTAF